MEKMKLNLLLLVLVNAAINAGGACAARLLLEDRNFSMVHMNVNAAAFDPNLNLVAGHRPELQSEVTGSNNPRDGIENVGDLVDIAHPGQNIIGTANTELLFEEKNARGNPLWSASSGQKELVFNVLPKGPETPSGPSHGGNAKVTEQRLWGSDRKSAVGHMEEDELPSLRSVPSPGVGH